MVKLNTLVLKVQRQIISITGVLSPKDLLLVLWALITITNTQSSATPSPFQQMVNFTSSDPGFSSIATKVHSR